MSFTIDFISLNLFDWVVPKALAGKTHSKMITAYFLQVMLLDHGVIEWLKKKIETVSKC